jgi:hypothetical protein
VAWKNLAGAALGAALILAGFVAIGRQQASASAEGEDERPYRGASAVMLGAVWILLGAGVVAFSLVPESVGGLVGILRAIGRAFLGD